MGVRDSRTLELNDARKPNDAANPGECSRCLREHYELLRFINERLKIGRLPPPSTK